MLPKIYWRVEPKNNSLAKRPWPRAFYSDGTLCALVSCSTPYGQRAASLKEHAYLTLTVVSPDNPRVVVAHRTFVSLPEAKKELPIILSSNRFLKVPDRTVNLEVAVRELRVRLNLFQKSVKEAIQKDPENASINLRTIADWEQQFKEFLGSNQIGNS